MDKQAGDDGWMDGWMDTVKMKDTKMSDSLPTVVAMTSNSQHQSDKLSDRKVHAKEESQC